MKISKTVNDYITKKVRKAYAPRLKEVDLDYLTRKAEIEAKIKSAAEKFKKDVLDIIENSCDEQWTFKPNARSMWNFDGYTSIPVHDTDAEQEYRNQRASIEQERDNKIEEILVTLELGGTKEDLNRMLSELEV